MTLDDRTIELLKAEQKRIKKQRVNLAGISFNSPFNYTSKGELMHSCLELGAGEAYDLHLNEINTNDPFIHLNESELRSLELTRAQQTYLTDNESLIIWASNIPHEDLKMSQSVNEGLHSHVFDEGSGQWSYQGLVSKATRSKVREEVYNRPLIEVCQDKDLTINDLTALRKYAKRICNQQHPVFGRIPNPGMFAVYYLTTAVAINRFGNSLSSLSDRRLEKNISSYANEDYLLPFFKEILLEAANKLKAPK